MAKGWIKLHRQLLDNDLWMDKPFDRPRAWIDMIFMANVVDKDLRLKNHYSNIHIERGSFFTSYRHLGDRWGWSVNKVKRYMDYLSVQGMITLCGTPNGTLVTLVKYGVYQGQRNTDEHTDGYTGGYTDEYTDGPRLKNVKNIKNDKEVYKPDESGTRTPTPQKHIFGAYKHVRLKDEEIEKLKKDFGETMTQECITFLDEYIEMKGYKARNHYLCIRKWVINAVKERQAKGSKPQAQIADRKIDFEALEKELLRYGG